MPRARLSEGLYSYALSGGVYIQDSVMHLDGVTGTAPADA